VADEQWDLDLLRAAKGYQRWILDAFGSSVRGDVLEVGAGTGNFTRWMTETADTVTALEPDVSNAASLRRLGLERVEVLERPIEDLAGEARLYDAITMINVLEHIPDDAAAVRVAAGLLAPGGALCILAPAHEMLMSRLDRGYGHVRRYRKAEVAGLLTQAGLKLRECRYFNALGGVGWLVFVRMARREKLSRASVALTERVAVPVGRRLERAVSPPFGQSVLAIAERDG
jgi:SAM-dependent methyltransferase